MEDFLLENNFHRLVFPPQAGKGKSFGFNLYAFERENGALLLDTGFKEHAEAASRWLADRGSPLEKVVISHFHADHIFGLKVLPGVEVLGSGRYQETMNLYLRPDTHHVFFPTKILEDGEKMTYGDFEFRFMVKPGHAACNVYTFINERYIHVGDDICASNDGHQLLPSTELFRIGDHIASLEMLKEFVHLTFLLSHGPPISGEKEILNIIENRQNYLKAVAASPTPISIEQALAGCTIDFLQKEWHAGMYEE